MRQVLDTGLDASDDNFKNDHLPLLGGDLGSLDTVHRHNPPNFAAILLRCYSYPDVFYEKVHFCKSYS